MLRDEGIEVRVEIGCIWSASRVTIRTKIVKWKMFIDHLAPIETGQKIVEYTQVAKVLGVYIDN